MESKPNNVVKAEMLVMEALELAAKHNASNYPQIAKCLEQARELIKSL